MTKAPIKLLITTVPWCVTESPLMAPALLKSMCVQKGIDTVATDTNILFLNFVEKNFDAQKISELQEFFYHDTPNPDIKSVTKVINFMVDSMLAHRPTHIALSLFTYTSQVACEWLCFQLRKKAPDIKLIIGGPGVFNTLRSETNFGEKLLEQKQIDYYIKGDGDLSLPELVLKDEKITGVNETTWQQLDDLNGQPFPDYSDYDWSLYKNKSVGVVGSRGCVRHCTFCDIHEHWKKYQWRSGEDIFRELIWHNTNSGVTKFKFQDSLINGNQLEFRKLMKLLAKHNDDNPQNKITWSSFFIFRPQKQMPEQDWIDISKSAELLTVGIESLNQDVRFHMGKKFTNKDMHYCFDMCMKYNIKVHMLLIVGYVLDNEQTHKETMDWFGEYKHYQDIIIGVSFGGTLGVLPGTEIFRRQEELGIELKDKQFDHQWSIQKTGNTPQVRLRWSREQTEACANAGFKIMSSMDNHLLMETMMK